MKKIFALTALALAASAALAQSVEIYGVADAGVQRVTGLRGGSSTQLISGMMEGSRWGLRGNEDLGGGFRALFTLESRVEIDTGSVSNRPPSGTQLPDRVTDARLLPEYNLVSGAFQPAFQQLVANTAGSLATQGFGVNLPQRLFDRQAYLGLVTPVGAILGGRQYTPAYEVNATFDIMRTESSLSAGQVASFPPSIDIRISNALAYRIVKDGVTASLMYGFGETGASTSNSRFIGAMAMYKNDAFSVGLGYNTRNNELGSRSLTSGVVGASVKVGSGVVSGLLASIKDNNPSDLSTIAAGISAQVPALAGTPLPALTQAAFINAFKQDAKLYHVGYRHVVGPNTVSVAYSLYNDDRPANADVASYGIAYTYSLSKRTDLNVVLTHFDNKNLAQTAPGQAGFFGGVTDSAGRDSNSLAVGVRHRF